MANIVNLGDVRSKFKGLREKLDELSVLTYQVEVSVVRELENLHYMLHEINEQISNDGKV